MNNTTSSMASLHISSPEAPRQPSPVPTPERSPEPFPEHSPVPTPEHSPVPTPQSLPQSAPQCLPQMQPQCLPQSLNDSSSKKRKRGSAGIALQLKKIKLLESFMEVSSLIISINNTI